jgi:FKBP-type peptidyl-prolyl cis-trans isomerase
MEGSSDTIDTSSKKRKREERKLEKASKPSPINEGDHADVKTNVDPTFVKAVNAALIQKSSSELDPRTKLILDVKEIARKREKARTEMNFILADKYRDELSALGVEVIDQKHGPSGWKFKDGSSKKLPPGVDIPVDPNRPKFPNNTNNTIASNATNKKSQTINTKVSSQMVAESNRAQELLSAMKPQLKPNQRSVHGVLIEDVSFGMKGNDMPVSKAGDKIKVHYIGRLKSNNKIFDQSKNKPFQFTLGRGEVIRGWDIGCAGMAVGAQRILTIPPEKAYGLRGSPPVIPGNATLVFEVTLIDIHSKRK